MSGDDKEVWPSDEKAATVSGAPTVEEWTAVPAGVKAPPAEPLSPFQYATRMVTGAANWGDPTGVSARLVAGKRALTGEEPDYSTAVTNLTKQNERFAADNPWGMVLPKTAAGLAGGGGTAAAVGKLIPALRAGGGLGARTAAGAVEGGLLGGISGAGHTYSGIPSDYAHNAGMGAIFGAGLGGAAPAIGTGAGKAYRWAADQGFGGGIPKPMIGPATADMAGIRNLPPGGMLPDAGPSMLGVAQGAVQGTGGKGKTELVGNLKARNDEVNPTLKREINQFGRAETPSFVDRDIGERMDLLGPSYERALNNARAIDTRPLALWLEGQIGRTAGPAQAVYREARAALDIPTNPGTLDPHPIRAQAIRTSFNNRARDTSTDEDARPALQQVSRRLTEELQAKVPGIRELDHQYAELGAQQRAIRTGSAGTDIFDTGKNNVYRPAEMAETMQQAVQPKGVNVGPSAEGFRLQQAARAEMERIVGTNKHNLTKLESVLAEPGSWNHEKLAIAFGQDRADRLMNVLQTLRAQRDTYQKVYEGSQTATREAAAKQLDAPTDIKVPLGQRTVFGTVTQPIEAGINNARAALHQSQKDRIAHLLATRDPARIQDIADQILGAGATRDARQQLIQRLIERGSMTGIPLAAPSVGR